MNIWSAYCDINLRNIFKNEYLAAQGIGTAERNDLMSKYKVYLDRFNGIPDIVQLREITDIDEMLSSLQHIFTHKWKNHIQENYSMMPTVFRQYGLFLQAENERQEQPFLGCHIEIDDNEATLHELSDYERPYIDDSGKLTIITHPELIARLKPLRKNAVFDAFAGIKIIGQFYGSQFPAMRNLDWQRLLQELLINGTPKKTKTGGKKSKIHLIIEKKVDQVMQPIDALTLIINSVGIEKVEKMHLKVKSAPAVTKRPPIGKEYYYTDMGNGWYLSTVGSTKEKLFLIRTIAVLARLQAHVEIV